MSDDPSSAYKQAQRELATWHATHPDSTFFVMKLAIERQIEQPCWSRTR